MSPVRPADEPHVLTTPLLESTREPQQASAPAGGGLGPRLAWVAIVALCGLHGWAMWVGMGGLDGLTNPWPIARDDHPIYFHSALVTRAFLKASGTTAGYDPSFMAGYAKSVVWPSSSTLPELVVFLFGGARPERAYKVYVFVAAALVPWLIAAAGRAAGLRAGAIATSVLAFLIYLWTDFPLNYAAFGMLPFFLGIPLGLLATILFTRYLERGGFVWWLAAALVSSLAWLVHLTTAQVVVPAALLAYLVAALSARRASQPVSISRHIGVWLVPILVLAVNAFWWLPGVWLASTKGPSDFAFAHSTEPLIGRLGKIVISEAPIESVLWGFGMIGIAVLAVRAGVLAAGLGGFLAASFFWGYLAAAFPALDSLQPGRHTYALYSGLALASGFGLSEVLARLRAGRGRLDLWAMLGLGLVSIRLFGVAIDYSVRSRLGEREPFLSSKPSPRLLWVVDKVRQHLKPGERLLYEEGGFGLPGVPDPFRGGRYSGLLPHLTGVEVIGGPYLHASLRTNFTQFGEGKLFGRERWDRAFFERYARLYRPVAILCWSPWARAFCRANADLIEVVDVLELPGEGALVFGRVRGFEGATIRGQANVRAEPGRLHVEGAAAGPDGLVVLRYHHVPYLRARPPAPLEAVYQEDDPVPFIGLRPATGPVTLELHLSP
jgi:hypothetical protein